MKPKLDEINFFSFDTTKKVIFNLPNFTEVVHISHKNANDVAALN